MSVFPERWARPDSLGGMIHDVGWLLLVVLVFAGITQWNPFVTEFSPTPVQLGGSVLIGSTIGIGLILFHARDGVRSWWKNKKLRFGVIFTLSLVIQFGLAFATTWTTLITLAASLTAIPARILVYILMSG